MPLSFFCYFFISFFSIFLSTYFLSSFRVKFRFIIFIINIQYHSYNRNEKILYYFFIWNYALHNVISLSLFSSPGLCMYSCNRISASANGNYRLRHHPEIRERTCLIVISGTAACWSRQRGPLCRKFWYINPSFCKNLKKYQHHSASQSSAKDLIKT